MITQAKETIIIVDETKIVPKLGVSFPVPVEVLPQAVAPVLRSLVAIGAGTPIWKEKKEKKKTIVPRHP